MSFFGWYCLLTFHISYGTSWKNDYCFSFLDRPFPLVILSLVAESISIVFSLKSTKWENSPCYCCWVSLLAPQPKRQAELMEANFGSRWLPWPLTCKATIVGKISRVTPYGWCWWTNRGTKSELTIPQSSVHYFNFNQVFWGLQG